MGRLARAAPARAVTRDHDLALHVHAVAFQFLVVVRHALIDVDQRGGDITIRGIDEANSALGEVSWISPIARALLKARVGDSVRLMTPAGPRDLEILSVSYPRPG